MGSVAHSRILDKRAPNLCTCVVFSQKVLARTQRKQMYINVKGSRKSRVTTVGERVMAYIFTLESRK